ncbi:MAG TPA: Amuc_1100 family pilus-like protein [Verrucomicrobiae bacterium]
MAWIKRNLIFFIGGIIAVALLGAAAFYDFQGLNHNATAKAKLNETYSTLKSLAERKPSPGNKKVNNIQTARDQEKQLRDWISRTGKYFLPIPPIPTTNVTSETFAAELRRTIDQLQHEAEKASVQLPPQYAFSFEAQRSLVKFAPGSLVPLAGQLGGVKTIAEVFFAARVNSLDSVQRVRVSDDDTAGPQADYIDDHAVTNNLAIVTPYVVTFRSFSGELAAVLSGLAASPHGFVVQGINVQPASSSSAPGSPPGNQPPPEMRQTMPLRGGMQPVLDEQLLRITLEIEIVQPLLKE